MKKKKGLINLIIIAEAVILVLVLIISAVSAIAGGGSEEETATAAAQTDAFQETESETETETAEEVSETYDEERISFSDEVEAILSELTTQQLAAQLFITTPEELTGYDSVSVAGDATEAALEEYPVSGLIYSELNFSGAGQTRQLLSGTQEYSQEITGTDLLLIVEETGGDTGSPVASNNGYSVQPSPAVLAQEGDADAVSEAAAARALYLTYEGFNMVLAPVADTASGDDEEADELCYGSDIETAAEYVAADITAMQEGGISSVLQAFPGLADAADDYTVYEAAIDAGVSAIQISNITAPDITGSGDLPCSLSAAVTELLRDEMGFEGILITADLSDGDITSQYSVGEAAVAAVCSGMNLLFVSDGFEDAYEAVLKAIESGEITETMLENAVGRVLTLKLSP